MALVDRFDGVIFDYGGVLVHHQTKDDAHRIADVTGLTTEEFEALYWGTRLDYDKGIVNGEQYWNRIAKEGGRHFDSTTVEKLVRADNTSWMNFDDRMFAWIEQLKTLGKRVAILSNMPCDLGIALYERGDVFAKFHHVTLSYEVGAAKPDAAIYHHCVNGLGVAAERTLFLDDRLENVVAAQAVGIESIQFTSRDEVLPVLLA